MLQFHYPNISGTVPACTQVMLDYRKDRFSLQTNIWLIYNAAAMLLCSAPGSSGQSSGQSPNTGMQAKHDSAVKFLDRCVAVTFCCEQKHTCVCHARSCVLVRKCSSLCLGFRVVSSATRGHLLSWTICRVQNGERCRESCTPGQARPGPEHVCFWCD